MHMGGGWLMFIRGLYTREICYAICLRSLHPRSTEKTEKLRSFIRCVKKLGKKGGGIDISTVVIRVRAYFGLDTQKVMTRKIF